MSDPFVGEIRMVGFNFPPRGWAICNGQLMPIAQNSALFALLGTAYGGDGVNTFGLPDLRGRVPTGVGQGPGTSNVAQGQLAGTPNVTMTLNQMPAHTHAAVFQGSSSAVTGAATIDIGTSSSAAIANPTNGGTTYLTAVTGATNVGDTVDFQGLYTTTAPANGAKATLGGVSGGGTVTPAGTVTIGTVGSNESFSVTQPYIGVNFAIALVGVFPSRN